MPDYHHDPTPNPFPGLRPFREDEDYLFFGRENQIDSMINILAKRRFLAVVGTSGSGKSSLVNCGLEPALHQGLMANACGSWRIVKFRPGDHPIKAMAQALAKDGALFNNFQEQGLTLLEMIESTLRLSSIGLLDIVEQASQKENFNLLLVADQFEELFRYRQLGKGADSLGEGFSEEATAFVRLLLEVFDKEQDQIHIALTMRSDFLGDCTQFAGLAEAINQSLYLVPRLTREERREAIINPVLVQGADITPVLVTRLVNDVGDNPDQLSILQHALHRTWSHWQSEGSQGPLDLPHYEAIGTMAEALDRHAEEAYSDLAEGYQDAGPSTTQQLCCRFFQAITDKASDGRGIRRPTKLGTLQQITGASLDELLQVIETFRDPCRSFLMPPAGSDLGHESVIDISHESLMRVWRRLSSWADEEARWAEEYRRLAETAERHKQGSENYLRDPALQLSLDWWELKQPNKAWAIRYDPGFDSAHAFLMQSKQARDEERRQAQQKQELELKREEEEREQERLTHARRLKEARLKQRISLVIATGFFLLFAWVSKEQQEANKQVGRTWKAVAEGLTRENQVNPEASIKLAIAALGRLGKDSATEALEIGVTLVQARDLYGEVDASHKNADDQGEDVESIALIENAERETFITGGSKGTLSIWQGSNIEKPKRQYAIGKGKLKVLSLTDQKVLIAGLETKRDSDKNTGEIIEVGTPVMELWNIGPDGLIKREKEINPTLLKGAPPIEGLARKPHGGGFIVYFTGNGAAQKTLLVNQDLSLASEFQVQGRINTCIFLGQGSDVLMSITDGYGQQRLEIWDSQRGKKLQSIEMEVGPNYVSSLLQLKDGTIASGDQLGNLQLWNPATFKRVGPSMSSQTRGIASLAQLRSGELVSGSFDGTLRRWQPTKDGLTSIGLPFPTGQGKIYSLLATKRNMSLISGGSNGSLKKWEWETSDPTQKSQEGGINYESVHASRLNNGTVFRIVLPQQKELRPGTTGTSRIVEYAELDPSRGMLQPFKKFMLRSESDIPTIYSLLAFQSSKHKMPSILTGHTNGTVRLWHFNGSSWEDKNIPLEISDQDRIYSLAQISQNTFAASSTFATKKEADGKGYLQLFKISSNGSLHAEGAPCRPESASKGYANENRLNSHIFALTTLDSGDLIAGYRNGIITRWQHAQKDWCNQKSLTIMEPGEDASEIYSLTTLTDNSTVASRGNQQMSVWRQLRNAEAAEPDVNIYTKQSTIVVSLARLASGDLIATDSNGNTKIYPSPANAKLIACKEIKDKLDTSSVAEWRGSAWSKPPLFEIEANKICKHILNTRHLKQKSA
jgi:WD40 repeat protein